MTDNFTKRLLLEKLQTTLDVDTDDPIHEDTIKELVEWLRSDLD